MAETKSSLTTDDLRAKGKGRTAKIECGKAHFKALAVGESPAQYRVARTLNDLLATN
jgi:type III restriction enzyme